MVTIILRSGPQDLRALIATPVNPAPPGYRPGSHAPQVLVRSISEQHPARPAGEESRRLAVVERPRSPVGKRKAKEDPKPLTSDRAERLSEVGYPLAGEARN
jgi:hypothetical protein